MKKILLITIAVFLLSLTLKAKEPTQGKRLTVTFINGSQIFAKSKRYLFVADCVGVVTLKVGDVIIASRFEGQRDAAAVFRRVR